MAIDTTKLRKDIATIQSEATRSTLYELVSTISRLELELWAMRDRIGEVESEVGIEYDDGEDGDEPEDDVEATVRKASEPE